MSIMGRSIAVSIIIAIGCGTEEPAGPSLAFEELRAEEIRSLCSYFVRCGLAPDEATCPGLIRLPVDDPSLKTAIDAGKVRYDGAAALACQEAMAARSCDVTTPEGRFPEICNQVFAGLTPEGGSCAFDAECSSGSCIEPGCPPGECCPGVCDAGERGPLGAPCISDLNCEAETFCGYTSRTCEALGALGAPCRQDAHCGYGSGCVGKTDLMDGTCQAMVLLGQSCTDDNCAEIGAYCNAELTCAPIGLDGDACTTDLECSQFAPCGDENTCEILPQVGATCTTRCAATAFCDEELGVCSDLLADEAFCDVPEQCASLHCIQGEIFTQCQPRKICF
jgi:hypothetical protein